MQTITYPSATQFPSPNVFPSYVQLKAADTGVEYQAIGGAWVPTPAANFPERAQNLVGGHNAI